MKKNEVKQVKDRFPILRQRAKSITSRTAIDGYDSTTAGCRSTTTWPSAASSRS